MRTNVSLIVFALVSLFGLTAFAQADAGVPNRGALPVGTEISPSDCRAALSQLVAAGAGQQAGRPAAPVPNGGQCVPAPAPFTPNPDLSCPPVNGVTRIRVVRQIDGGSTLFGCAAAGNVAALSYVNRRFAQMAHEIAELRHQVGALRRRLEAQQAALEVACRPLEAQAAANQQSVTANADLRARCETFRNQLDAELREIQTALDSHARDLAGLTQIVQDHTNRLDALEGQVRGLRADVDQALALARRAIGIAIEARERVSAAHDRIPVFHLSPRGALFVPFGAPVGGLFTAAVGVEIPLGGRNNWFAHIEGNFGPAYVGSLGWALTGGGRGGLGYRFDDAPLQLSFGIAGRNVWVPWGAAPFTNVGRDWTIGADVRANIFLDRGRFVSFDLGMFAGGGRAVQVNEQGRPGEATTGFFEGFAGFSFYMNRERARSTSPPAQ